MTPVSEEAYHFLKLVDSHILDGVKVPLPLLGDRVYKTLHLAHFHLFYFNKLIYQSKFN
jgi:hypothetical protein